MGWLCDSGSYVCIQGEKDVYPIWGATVIHVCLSKIVLFFYSCIIKASGSLACPVQKIIVSAVLAWVFSFFQGMFPKTQLLLNCLVQETICLGQGSTASHRTGCGNGWVLIISMKVDTFPSLSDTTSNFNKCFFVCLLDCRQDSNIFKIFSGAAWADGYRPCALLPHWQLQQRCQEEEKSAKIKL